MIAGDPWRFDADLDLVQQMLEAGRPIDAAVLCASIGQRYRFEAILPWDSDGRVIDGEHAALAAAMLSAARSALMGDTRSALDALAAAKRRHRIRWPLRLIPGGGQPARRRRVPPLRLL